MEKLLTVKDVAEYFSVRPERIREWVRAGKIKATRLKSGGIRFTLTQVAAHIKK